MVVSWKRREGGEKDVLKEVPVCRERCEIWRAGYVAGQTTSLLPKWWLLYHVRWLNRVASAELGLTAFIRQLIIIFCQKWVYISKKTFYDPTLKNEYKNRNYSSKGESSFYIVLEMAKISFLFSLGSSLLLTSWLHQHVFNPMVKNFHAFNWSAWAASISLACFVFFTLILFPVHLWLQEMNMKKRLILGSSYYLGWLVFLTYILCGETEVVWAVLRDRV
ncbi:outer dense fiber protein 4 [Phascolarctos cinereus]